MATKPVFEHHHYKAIAATIAKVGFSSNIRADDEWTTMTLRNALADMFAADNPRFNRDRFIAAAMGQPVNGRDKVRP